MVADRIVFSGPNYVVYWRAFVDVNRGWCPYFRLCLICCILLLVQFEKVSQEPSGWVLSAPIAQAPALRHQKPWKVYFSPQNGTAPHRVAG